MSQNLTVAGGLQPTNLHNHRQRGANVQYCPAVIRRRGDTDLSSFQPSSCLGTPAEARRLNRLLMATAVCEAAAGIALIGIPSSAAMLLIGAPLTNSAATTVARVGGAGLLALGIACWLARGAAQDSGARALVAAMVFYNVGAALILGDAGIRLQPVGLALWPAVAFHVAMAVWCYERVKRTEASPLR